MCGRRWESTRASVGRERRNPRIYLSGLIAYHAIRTNMIRPANINDIPRIQEIINSHAELGKMLFKATASSMKTQCDFGVYEEQGKLLGRCVPAAGVDDHLGGSGGRRAITGGRGTRARTRHPDAKLVEWSIAEARRLGIARLMALTYEQEFFGKLGFRVVPKETLPLKVWSDCVRCPKKDGCDEIAVVLDLPDVARPDQPAAARNSPWREHSRARIIIFRRALSF